MYPLPRDSKEPVSCTNMGCDGYVKAEIEPFHLKRSSRFQRLFPNPSWSWCDEGHPRYQKLAPTFPRDTAALWWLNGTFSKWKQSTMDWNGKSQNVLKVDCCLKKLTKASWEAAVHPLISSWKKMDVKLVMMILMMMIITFNGNWTVYLFNLEQIRQLLLAKILLTYLLTNVVNHELDWWPYIINSLNVMLLFWFAIITSNCSITFSYNTNSGNCLTWIAMECSPWTSSAQRCIWLS